jgi:hypothetical protein
MQPKAVRRYYWHPLGFLSSILVRAPLGNLAPSIGVALPLVPAILSKMAERLQTNRSNYETDPTEVKYMEDLWMREERRLYSTFWLVSATGVPFSWMDFGHNSRLPTLFGFLVCILIATPLLFLSIRNKIGTSQCRSLVQGIAIASILCNPSAALFDAFVTSDNMRSSNVPYNIAMNVVTAPLLLSFMNVRYKHAFIITGLSFGQLMLTSVKYASSESLTQLNQYSPIVTLSWAFCLVSLATWQLEMAERKLFWLRQVIDERHSVELKQSQQEPNVYAEETRMSSLAHEIRNPYNGRSQFATHVTPRALLLLYKYGYLLFLRCRTSRLCRPYPEVYHCAARAWR